MKKLKKAAKILGPLGKLLTLGDTIADVNECLDKSKCKEKP